MKKSLASIFLITLSILFLSACGPIGKKAASMATVYGAAAFLSLLLLVSYCSIAKKRDSWYLLLFASVLVVNIGYFALSISRGLDEALLANRISYLGSVFLPLSMLMIIINATHIRYGRWLQTMLLSIAVVIFPIAASPGDDWAAASRVSGHEKGGGFHRPPLQSPLVGCRHIWLRSSVRHFLISHIEAVRYSLLCSSLSIHGLRSSRLKAPSMPFI